MYTHLINLSQQEGDYRHLLRNICGGSSTTVTAPHFSHSILICPWNQELSSPFSKEEVTIEQGEENGGSAQSYMADRWPGKDLNSGLLSHGVHTRLEVQVTSWESITQALAVSTLSRCSPIHFASLLFVQQASCPGSALDPLAPISPFRKDMVPELWEAVLHCLAMLLTERARKLSVFILTVLCSQGALILAEQPVLPSSEAFPPGRPRPPGFVF